jgi:hypothetical protein
MSERGEASRRTRTPLPVRRHRVAGGVSRGPIIVAIAIALLAGGLVDRAASSRAPVASTAALAAASGVVPAAAPPGALSTSWFCAGATDTSGGRAPGSVIIANSGNRPAAGVVTLVPGGGPSVKVPVSVPGDSSKTVSEDVPGGSAWIGAIVDVDAGAVSVEQEIDGGGGLATTPCATSGSSHWYFTDGQTLVNAGVEISLLNPYPVDTVVDLSFTTDQGVELPVGFEGIVVPHGGLVTVNLGDHLRRRQEIATTVTARTGRVVAWETRWIDPPAAGAAILGTPAAQAPLADPAAPIPGATVELGAPSAGTHWVWPDGDAGNGVSEQYVIYNPGVATADVRLAIQLDQGVAEPFELSVPPGQVIPVASDQQARIPAGVAHSAVLDSLNGVPVVAGRMVSATSPSPWQGIADMLGQRVASDRWLVAGALADPTHDGWVVVYNPGSDPLRVVVDALKGGAQVPLAGEGTVTVPPQRRAAIHLNQGGATLDAPLVVSAAGPFYVESNVYGAGGSPGVSLAPGVPLIP